MFFLENCVEHVLFENFRKYRCFAEIFLPKFRVVWKRRPVDEDALGEFVAGDTFGFGFGFGFEGGF